MSAKKKSQVSDAPSPSSTEPFDGGPYGLPEGFWEDSSDDEEHRQSCSFFDLLTGKALLFQGNLLEISNMHELAENIPDMRRMTPLQDYCVWKFPTEQKSGVANAKYCLEKFDFGDDWPSVAYIATEAQVEAYCGDDSNIESRCFDKNHPKTL